jgi:2-polyprenyl-3-methyl-5-hydroxy-6-metoxy-1,4-benzoquinol methylase
VARARLQCPEYRFLVADVCEPNLLEEYDYDAIVCTEFLEHVGEDIECLTRIRRGSLVFGSVPSFPSAGHVRTFSSEKEVRSRYGEVLGDLWVKRHQLPKPSAVLFLFQGRRL